METTATIVNQKGLLHLRFLLYFFFSMGKLNLNLKIIIIPKQIKCCQTLCGPLNLFT